MGIKSNATKSPVLQLGSPKTGSHTHQCSRDNHVWDCQYSTKCHVETSPAAQTIIDEMCPVCFNLRYGNFAS